MPAVSIQQAFQLALQHREAGRLAEAEAVCRQILAVQPGHVGALHCLWVMAQQPHPESPQTLKNLGRTLAARGRLEEAVGAFCRVVELSPGDPEGHNNLGIVLARQGRFGEAAGSFRRALQFLSGSAETWSNLGNALKAQGQFDEAVACYRRALAGQPDFADAHLNLGLLLLLLGHAEEGWREYEWRLRSVAYARRRRFSAPQWEGSPAAGKTILVHAEQGYGDTLQFVRYLPLVVAQSQTARIVLECQAALVPFLQPLRDAGIDVVARGASDEALPPFDLHLPLFSAPLALRCFSVPPIAPCLQADAGLRARWRERIGSDGRRRVGLVWAGDPAHADDSRRSIAFEKWGSILRVPGVRFFSLQVANKERLEINMPVAGVLDYLDYSTKFDDSASLFTELDLVITVDTAAAHLAGVLGLPAWVLLPFVPDWRWGLGRDDTPWYPTARLFRQATARDWDEVLARVAAALRERCG